LGYLRLKINLMAKKAKTNLLLPFAIIILFVIYILYKYKKTPEVLGAAPDTLTGVPFAGGYVLAGDGAAAVPAAEVLAAAPATLASVPFSGSSAEILGLTALPAATLPASKVLAAAPTTLTSVPFAGGGVPGGVKAAGGGLGKTVGVAGAIATAAAAVGLTANAFIQFFKMPWSKPTPVMIHTEKFTNLRKGSWASKPQKILGGTYG